MASNSRIEWTESTWNPVTGCTKVSEGCRNCYAEKIANRLKSMGQPNHQLGFELSLQPQMLEKPLEWKKPKTIFVNSMSDLFHKDVPDEYIRQVFEVMSEAHWHRFQVLTKRADRLERLARSLDWRPNIWMGVSVENRKALTRIDCLRNTPAHIRFLSIEPLIEALPNLSLKGIHWVIVGGESGPKSRKLREEWVLDIKSVCEKANVPFFFKQWGGANKKKNGRLLLGRTWDELP